MMMKSISAGLQYLPLAVAGALLSGCGASGTERNADRTDSFTDILSEADRTRASDIARHIDDGTLQGTATYEGVAAANFGNFTGTADATFVADFDNQTIRGNMTRWEDGKPQTHNLRGQIALSNGTFERTGGELDGTFSGLVTGNLERTRLAERDPETGETIFSQPVTVVLDGVAEGAFFDSGSGAIASQLSGDMVADYADSEGRIGQMTGGFVAEK